MTQFEEDIVSLVKEIRRVSDEKHTGSMQINLHMNQGGIGQINVNITKNLKNPKKRVVRHG